MHGKVLVADDSFTVRMKLEDALRAADFAVTPCDSRAALMERIARESFALIIVDPMLRDGNGIELLKDLRSSLAKSPTPLLVLSGQADLRHRIRAIELGADDVIDKPYHPEYLLQRVFDLTVGPRSITRVIEGAQPGRLLVVDDSVTYGNALVEELRRDGHDVILAHTANDALALLAVQSVACVIVDVFMPEVSGVQLCQKLQTDAGMRNTGILGVSGRKDSSIRDSVIEAGADDFAIKTHDLASLRERVREMLLRPRRLRRTGRLTSPRIPLPSQSSTGMSPAPLSSRTGVSLLDQVIYASGMSELLGRSTLSRACERAGIDPIAMSRADLGRALPFIAQALALFVPPDEVRARVERVAALSDRDSAA